MAARIVFADGSKEMARNTSDLVERWETRRAMQMPQDNLRALARDLGVSEDEALEFSLWLVNWLAGAETNGLHALYTRYLHISAGGDLST